MRFIDQLKKTLVLTVAALSVTIVSVTNSKADAPAVSTGDLLQQIAQNTYGTLKALQNLPTYFYGFAQFVTSWMALETDTTTSASLITTTQSNFAQLGNIFATSSQAQASNGIQQQLFAELIGAPASAFTGKDPAILTPLPNVNDLAFSTLIGAPPVSLQGQQPNTYAYIKNASGLNFPHPYPYKLAGSASDIAKYTNYFYTISAIQSFNNYIISKVGTSSTATPIQSQLVNQASNSAWLAQIATEELGKVLRQILIFESQNYVLNTQIQQAMTHTAATQAMTNSLLILFNQQQENQLYRSAQGLTN